MLDFARPGWPAVFRDTRRGGSRRPRPACGAGASNRVSRRIEIQRRGVTGNWDADRLAQVVSNIIGNALQHGCEGEPVEVRLDGMTPDAVTCKRSMPVRSIAVLPRVFELFPAAGGSRVATTAQPRPLTSPSRSCMPTMAIAVDPKPTHTVFR
jgi:hypothetical protein